MTSRSSASGAEGCVGLMLLLVLFLIVLGMGAFVVASVFKAVMGG